jgi:hypothetical protein
VFLLTKVYCIYILPEAITAPLDGFVKTSCSSLSLPADIHYPLILTSWGLRSVRRRALLKEEEEEEEEVVVVVVIVGVVGRL